jgi:hypothetical protein
MDSDIKDVKSLAEAVERRYTSSFTGKFPYNDCYALQKMFPKLTAAIIPDLDEYFSFIAGYSSSATRMSTRSMAELRNAVPKLRKSFFDKHPAYEPLREAMAQTETLSRKMCTADELRRDLVAIMERVE